MSNIPVNIDNLDLKQLKWLLKEIRLYDILKRQLGNRWKEIFNRLKTWKQKFLVEYFSSISEDIVWEESKKVYKKVFDLDVERKDIIFSSNKEIKWWIKVFLDDKMVDLSYQRIEKMITK